MKFEEIEDRRARLRISQAELCRRATVHPVSYGRWKRGASRPNTATLERVEQALEHMTAELQQAVQ